MEWTADVAVGDWLRDRLDDPWRATMHDVVPRGYPAYARIFHSAFRDRPVGRPWPGLPYNKHAKQWEAFHAAGPEIDSERVTWAATARSFGTVMHATARWHRIVGARQVHSEDGPRDAAGWRYTDPSVGDLDPEQVTAVAETLARHTSTSRGGYIGVWQGWGGLVGGMGFGPSRTFFTIGSDEPPAPSRHEQFLSHAARDAFNDVFRTPTWQSGTLPDHVSQGARLHLPGRKHVLFRGGIDTLVDPDWVLRMPWRDREAETHGFEPTAQSPSIVWPDDRAWVLVTEVDFDSTVVAGSRDLIRDIVADPSIEAADIREGTSLSWDADEVTR